MPRRRRARAVVVEADSERGFAMRILLHSPKDVVAGAFAFAAVIAIIANALFLQAGRHPSPMFGSVVAMPAAALAPASPLPRPRPVEADATLSEPKAADAKPAEPKATDPLASLVKATSAPAATASNIVRPPAPIAASSRNETIANPSPGRCSARLPNMATAS